MDTSMLGSLAAHLLVAVGIASVLLRVQMPDPQHHHSCDLDVVIRE